jgi:hypothetical protein
VSPTPMGKLEIVLDSIAIECIDAIIDINS